MPDKSIKVWLHVDGRGQVPRKKNPGEVYRSDKEPQVAKNRWKKGCEGYIRAMLSWHVPNKKGMGRSKGNTLERDVALILSLWIYGEAGVLKRTPLSGGWASGKAGDVILDHELERKGYWNPPIYVECRSYKDLLQHNLLTWIEEGTPKTLTTWVKEVETKCDGRLPMLIIKGNGTKPYLLMKDEWMTLRGMRRGFIYQKGAIEFIGPDRLGYVLLPLERIGQLGDGEVLLKSWVEDDGPANLREYFRLIRKRKGKKADAR